VATDARMEKLGSEIMNLALEVTGGDSPEALVRPSAWLEETR